MAVGEPQLRYATHTETADGIKTDFEVNFVGGYINPSNVLCISMLVDEDTGLTTDRQIHTTEIVSTSGNAATVRVSPAVAAGRTVVIFRDTAKTAMLVQYLNGSILSKSNLDLANKQLLMLIQEMLDGLNENTLTIHEAISAVVDINTVITDIYQQVMDLLNAGGIVSVAPRVWHGVGNDGETVFDIPGADVDGDGFYDTYVGGMGLEPGVDYTIDLGDGEDPPTINFETAPADGVRWFTVLRGYAKPYVGAPPITSLRIPVRPMATSPYFVTAEDEFALLRCSVEEGETAVAFITEVPELGSGVGEGEDGDPVPALGTGSYLSFKQTTEVPVEVQADTEAVILDVPSGYLPRTRALNSVISVVCDSGPGNLWTVAGDLAPEEEEE